MTTMSIEGPACRFPIYLVWILLLVRELIVACIAAFVTVGEIHAR